MIKNEVQRLILLIHLRKYEDKSKRQLRQDQTDRNHSKKFWFWQLSEMQIGRRIRPLVELSGETKGATGKMTTRQVFGGARPGDNIDSIGKHRNSSRLFVWPTHLPWAAFRLKKRSRVLQFSSCEIKDEFAKAVSFHFSLVWHRSFQAAPFWHFLPYLFVAYFLGPPSCFLYIYLSFFGKFLSFRLFFHIEPLRDERGMCAWWLPGNCGGHD